MKHITHCMYVVRDDQRTLTCSAPLVSHMSSLTLPPSTFRENSPTALRIFGNGDTGQWCNILHTLHSQLQSLNACGNLRNPNSRLLLQLVCSITTLQVSKDAGFANARILTHMIRVRQPVHDHCMHADKHALSNCT